eukprot:Seg2670.4 transcript_id=Seg2670.4/GoldUCD/mRNA.D3Y31 product="hypothetical protein" protein_id=Seg2670.4/GoldUCD/D3Y31
MELLQCVILLILLAIFPLFQGHATQNSDGLIEKNQNEEEAAAEEMELDGVYEFEAEDDYDDAFEQKMVHSSASKDPTRIASRRRTPSWQKASWRRW